jgi:hypothetical protein
MNPNQIKKTLLEGVQTFALQWNLVKNRAYFKAIGTVSVGMGWVRDVHVQPKR